VALEAAAELAGRARKPGIHFGARGSSSQVSEHTWTVKPSSCPRLWPKQRHSRRVL